MNLSDFQNTAREKLSSLQGTAREVDFSDTLNRLVIIGLLPFTACLIILFATPDIKPKLLVDSILVAVILWVGGGVLGGFKWSSQHGLCELFGGTGPEPRPVFSSPGSFAVCC